MIWSQGGNQNVLVSRRLTWKKKETSRLKTDKPFWNLKRPHWKENPYRDQTTWLKNCIGANLIKQLPPFNVSMHTCWKSFDTQAKCQSVKEAAAFALLCLLAECSLQCFIVSGSVCAFAKSKGRWASRLKSPSFHFTIMTLWPPLSQKRCFQWLCVAVVFIFSPCV